MCLARGDRITLLTSVYFHCSQDTTITSAAGNLMNLAVAIACFALLRFRFSSGWRLLLVFAAAFNAFWACGYIILSAVSDNGDWAFVLHDLSLNPLWLWRGLMAFLGVTLYYVAIRLVVPRLPAAHQFSYLPSPPACSRVWPRSSTPVPCYLPCAIAPWKDSAPESACCSSRGRDTVVATSCNPKPRFQRVAAG
jgi:hypothetical protein